MRRHGDRDVVRREAVDADCVRRSRSRRRPERERPPDRQRPAVEAEREPGEDVGELAGAAGLECGIELRDADDRRLHAALVVGLELREVPRQHVAVEPGEVQPPPGAAVAVLAAEALVVERQVRRAQPPVEVVGRDDVLDRGKDEHRHGDGASFGGPLRQPVAGDVRVLHHVEELVGDGGVEAAECLRHARVEAWRDEHEAAALAGLLTEGEAERSRREGVDVDVGLRVRPGRVREGNLEAVLLVVGERDIGGRGDLLDVVGIPVAVVVVQRRSVGPAGDVVDDRTSTDVRRRLRRLERVRAAARRSLDVPAASAAWVPAASAKPATSVKARARRPRDIRTRFRQARCPQSPSIEGRQRGSSARSSASAAPSTRASWPGGAASCAEAGRPSSAGPQGTAAAGQPVALNG